MVSRSLLYLLLLTALCISTPAAAATLSYTGNLAVWSDSVRMCAEGMDGLGQPAAEEPILFTALDLWNTTRLSPSSIAVTNCLGTACMKASLSPGVYEAQAFGSNGGPLAGVASQPVAITVWSRHSPPGIYTSATLAIREPGQTRSRLVTLGWYYVYAGLPAWIPGVPISYLYFPEGATEQLLLLDPDNPGGPVRVRMRGFRQAYVRYTPAMSAIDMRFTGYCEFTIGDAKPVTRICELVTTTPGRYRMDVDVYDYRWKSIYHAGGFPTLHYPE